jgi:transcriptional regulator GlxA family with amidase domain
MKFGIFFFDGVEPLDVVTLGVLSIARRFAPQIEIFSVAPRAGVVHLANGFKMIADHGIDDLPEVDVIVITGGAAWTEQVKSEATLDFFRKRAASTVISSVCTGGMILGATGLLDGKKATTRCESVHGEISPLARMANLYPAVNVVQSSLVDEGTLITGGGACLCIDMMLHLLRKKLGEEVANDVARLLEYSRAWEANARALPPIGVSRG